MAPLDRSTAVCARLATATCVLIALGGAGCARTAGAQSRAPVPQAPRSDAATTTATTETAASPPATPAGAWYAVDPLLASLRPAARANLAATAGVASLDALPLYDLAVTLRDDGRAFALREEVWFTNTEAAPLDEVVFRVYANASPSPRGTTVVVNPPVRFRRGACAQGCAVAAEGHSVVAVRPSTPLAPGARLRVVLEFDGTLDVIDPSRTNLFAQGMEGLSSLGASESAGGYGLLATGDGIASLGNFYAVLARRTRGQWERADASTLGDLGSDVLSHVRARVELPAASRVAATGVIVSDAPVTPPAARAADAGAPPAARHAVTVVAGMVRDFALLASPALVTATRRVGDVEVRAHFLPAERAAGEHVLDTAAVALAQFERRFGAYPYADLDVVEAPLVGGAGGVEFAGLVTVASMFYRPAAPASGPMAAVFAMLGAGGGAGGGGPNLDAMVGSMREFVTAHEVAHQFWHGVVGSDSREHPFVDEGLAQYSAVLYMEDRYGAARARREADAQVRANYHLMRLLGTADAAVDRPVAAFGSSLAYAGLVYGKGPLMYPALRAAVGDAAFFAGLRAYVDRYRFRLAPPRGLIDVLATGPRAARVRALAQRWLEQAQGDADLGRPDLGAMLAGAMGGGNAGSLGPQLQQALQMLGSGPGGLGVLGGGGAAAGHGGASGANGGPTPEQLRELMRQLPGMLDGLDPEAR